MVVGLCGRVEAATAVPKGKAAKGRDATPTKHGTNTDYLQVWMPRPEEHVTSLHALFISERCKIQIPFGSMTDFELCHMHSIKLNICAMQPKSQNSISCP